jgi:hypothetical protein
MADEDERAPKLAQEQIERWRARLESGEPVMTFVIDEPLEVAVTPEGAMVLKFVWGQIGNFDRAAMAQAVLTPVVARRLKATFPNVQNIPDTPLPAPGPQSKN